MKGAWLSENAHKEDVVYQMANKELSGEAETQVCMFLVHSGTN